MKQRNLKTLVCKYHSLFILFQFAKRCSNKFRGDEWSFKTSGSRKILVEFHGSRSLVFYTKGVSESVVTKTTHE